MIDPIKHYSIENPATVYDEESLTVLKLVARLSAKVNEIITKVNDTWNHLFKKLDDTTEQVVTEMMMAGKFTFGIYPSGDLSGATDRANIQRCMDEWGSVFLNEGDFYLDAPLLLSDGVSIYGGGPGKTHLHWVGDEQTAGFTIEYVDAHNNRYTGSAANVTMKDFCIHATPYMIALDLLGGTAAPYNGARYCLFENIRVEGGVCGVQLGGAWCCSFIRCTFFPETAAVHHRGTCNNIRYEHCTFAAAGSSPSAGVEIMATGGAQNCGITFVDCDFERFKTALKATTCVSLNVKNIYVEGCDTVFHIDSCPGFNVDGGYCAYIKRLATVFNNNTAAIYGRGRGEIRNVFVRFITDENHDTNNRAYLVTATDPRTYNLDLFNVSAEDVSGNGCEIFFYNRDLTQKYGAGRDYHRVLIIDTKNGSGFSSAIPVRVACGQRDSMKLVNVKLVCKSNTTINTPSTVSVALGDTTVWTFNITPKDYAAGEVVNGTPQEIVIMNPDSTNTLITDGATSAFETHATVVYGEMIASKVMA